MEYRRYIEKGPMPSRRSMRELLRRAVDFTCRAEEVDLLDCMGRVTAQKIKTKRELPNVPVGKMDGIGVRADAFAGGIPDTSSWQEKNEYVFVNTGCAILPPYDTLIMIEDVDFSKGYPIIKKIPRAGQMVDLPGSGIGRNEVLLPRNMQITPPLMGLMAAGGIEKVSVIAKPKVAFIPTGDELSPWRESFLPAGKNIESNSVMIYGFLQEYNAEPIILPIVPDDRDALRKALEEAAEQADIILINAGSSKGTKDFTLDILESEGRVLVYELGCRPGKHSSFSFFRGKPVLGMAGPPNGAELAARFYLSSLISVYYGQKEKTAVLITAKADFSFQAADEFDFCVQAHICSKNGEYHAAIINPKAVTRPFLLQKCNSYIYLPAGQKITAGDKIEAELLTGGEAIDQH
ncbi:molybdopterin molybdotransferase MoeA [Pectinatus haikarae]|uniref:molybdopterin molybdotransferase MoeA n=1 Tax=Pectinatus haikarae TaxID=349096 RepID=UPI0018C510E6|nr:molybdopterin molybdotransferase MoeA [Pectinatus haikarae]